jgi:hypothetical protein
LSESHAEDTSSGFCHQPGSERLRWRSWLCPKCSRGVTPIGHLFTSLPASKVLSLSSPEETALSQITALQEWIESCHHYGQFEISFPKLAEGSEHLVFLKADGAMVFKTTRPGIFGESYYLDPAGKINQKNCSPLDYLIRLRLWKKLFRSAPQALGMTDKGQIISSHQFIAGHKPAQSAVDSFLSEGGLTPIRQEYWLWKRSFPGYEIWLGDGRDDNFVQTEAGIVPIDIRLWFSSESPFDGSTKS